ncbi:MAG: PP2C family protein-serine/threonine phosphatase [Pseudomonadota bacterium]
MSLLVLDPDIAAAQKFAQQLTDLGFDTLVSTEPGAASGLCSQGHIELLVCCDDKLLQQVVVPAGVGYVYATQQPPEVGHLLQVLDEGVQDIWPLPMPDEKLRNKVHAIIDRMQHWLNEVSRELRDARSELERDQRAGQYIQMGMLPPNPMGIGHYRLQHKVEPSLILSGDFVDYFQITDRYFACYVADVSGHGASSAFVTVLLKNFSRRLRREYRPSMLTQPGEVLAWINAELIDQQIDKHVAMFFAVVDMRDNCLHYANAAHFPPAALVQQNQITSLEQKGKPLGLFPALNFESRTVDFPEDSRLVVFSDGVLDLLKGSTLEDKEQQLSASIVQQQTLSELWSVLDTTKLGADDVSCLLVNHEH